MSEYTAEIAAIREAISSGVRRVRTRSPNGVEREVEYPTFDDLKKRLDWLSGKEAALSPVRPSRASVVSFSRGR